ncbi:MAG TPA: sigma 54-interacting transcriptional regulator [Methylosinus sp.]|jgi:two-component system nitrogen regulation response regulator GlnG|uniref:sigma 54-interacting transcriptional regulator n=1 Tax=Methylosinus sp. TaxID=427 RepID=UPI002F9313EC
MAQGEIIIADDNAADRIAVAQALSSAGYEVRATAAAATLWRWVQSGEGDLVVTDTATPEQSAYELLPRIKKLRPDLPIIVTGAQSDLVTAIPACEHSAYGYLPKPFDAKELIGVVGRAIAEPREKNELRLYDEIAGIPLNGCSQAMQDIHRLLAHLARTDFAVMIEGEFGTGKEAIARTLQAQGKRSGGPFVGVNLAAIPQEQIESELFGHDPRGFGCTESCWGGRFAEAEGGALFLDEIGELPMEAQAQLLRVLERGEYVTIGGRAPVKTSVRIVAATSKDLRALVRHGLFREDLYFRLNVAPLRVPPLRERTEDIPDIVHHFLKILAREGSAPKHVDPRALDCMKRYRWPGNIRELENFIRRIAILHPQSIITEQLVEQELQYELGGAVVRSLVGEEPPFAGAVKPVLRKLFEDCGDRLPRPGLYHRVIREIEAPLITEALAATGGHQIKAAELLGLNRNTLRKKMIGLDVHPRLSKL